MKTMKTKTFLIKKSTHIAFVAVIILGLVFASAPFLMNSTANAVGDETPTVSESYKYTPFNPPIIDDLTISHDPSVQVEITYRPSGSCLNPEPGIGAQLYRYDDSEYETGEVAIGPSTGPGFPADGVTVIDSSVEVGNHYWYVFEITKHDVQTGRKGDPEDIQVSELPKAPTPKMTDVLGHDSKMDITWKAGTVATKTQAKAKVSSFAATSFVALQGGSIGTGKEFKIYRTDQDPGTGSGSTAYKSTNKVKTFLTKLIPTASAAVKTAGGWSPVGTASVAKYTDTTAKNGTHYWYKVKETGVTGKTANSDYSEIKSDIPHKNKDVNQDNKINWTDVARVLMFGKEVINNPHVTEDVNNNKKVDWNDVLGGVLEGVLEDSWFKVSSTVSKNL